jgi:hypothetical protein
MNFHLFGGRHPENIARARLKSDGRARFNTAGFSRVFHMQQVSPAFGSPMTASAWESVVTQ